MDAPSQTDEHEDDQSATADDDVISGSEVEPAQGGASSRQNDYDDDELTASIKEPEKLQLLDSLFPSHHSSPEDNDEVPWTQSRQNADRRQIPFDHLRDQPPGEDDDPHGGTSPPLESTDVPGIVVIDTARRSDDRWAARKQRKRVMLDELPPVDYRSRPRLRGEFPRRGKSRRRPYLSSRGHQRQRERHGYATKYRGYTAAASAYRSRSANLPIGVAIRPFESRQRRSRHHHHWHSSNGGRRHRHHRSKSRRARRTIDVINVF